jgi:hypothetical protein
MNVAPTGTMAISILTDGSVEVSRITYQNRMVCRARRANSGEIGGERTWDGVLCVRNPWLNRDRDGRMRVVGAWRKDKTRLTRRESRLGWKRERKGR